MEILSNKLLATAFEASLGCMAVMSYAKRRQQSNRDSICQLGEPVFSLLSVKKRICPTAKRRKANECVLPGILTLVLKKWLIYAINGKFYSILCRVN